MKPTMTNPYIQKIIFAIIVGILMPLGISAQSNKENKEVIIIEKTVDQNGNIISKSIKRNQGNYSDDEINNMMESEDQRLPGSFDMEGMGFDGFNDLFFDAPQRNSSRGPSMGIQVVTDNGQALVSEVAPGSGAAEADIRAGDKILAVRGIPVESAEEIIEVLKNRENGEEIDVLVWRDGSEIEKKVTLQNNRGNSFGQIFDLPEGMNFQFFGDSGSMSMDSMMKRLQGMNKGMFDMEGFDFGDFFGADTEVKSRSRNESTRPQLGLFIDQENGEGIVVTDVIPDSAAEDGGIRAGDIILRLDDNVVSSFRELKAWLNTKEVGDQASISILRNGKKKEIVLDLK